MVQPNSVPNPNIKSAGRFNHGRGTIACPGGNCRQFLVLGGAVEFPVRLPLVLRNVFHSGLVLIGPSATLDAPESKPTKIRDVTVDVTSLDQ